MQGEEWNDGRGRRNWKGGFFVQRKGDMKGAEGRVVVHVVQGKDGEWGYRVLKLVMDDGRVVDLEGGGKEDSKGQGKKMFGVRWR